MTITTTHLKRGWIRANGVPQSDAATVTEHLIRHGDVVTVFAVVNDPVYLSEPMTRTSLLFRQPIAPDAWLYACDDSEQIPSRENNDDVPSHLFGQNPFVREYAEQNKVPLLGAFGGPETMYPEILSAVSDNTRADAAALVKMLPSGPQQASLAPDPTPADGTIHVFHVAGSVYMLAGDGANIAIQVGPQGALVVDTGAGKLSDKVLAEIGKLSSKPVQFIVNTSFHKDHTGGNVKLQAAGADPSLTGSFFSNQFSDAGQGATVIGHQNVQLRMREQKPPLDAPPSDTYTGDRRRKYHNGEAVEIFPQPNAITDGDSIVHRPGHRRISGDPHSSSVEAGEREWQGFSKATWFKQPQSTGLGFGFPEGGIGSFAGGNLKVVTTNMRAGYLRKNGVPYSEDAVLTEYFNRHREPAGSEWFTVTTIVDDPKYLTMPFITSSSFRKEPDGSKWRPNPCEIDPPREAQAR